MESERRLRRGRFVLAIAVSAALVLSAPFIGFVRSWIRATFPGQYVRIIGGAIALIAFGAVIAALWRIRSHRVLRYSAIAASLAFATWYSLADSTGNPDADVVQRFHFVEYGIIAFLFYRAWRPLAGLAFRIPPQFRVER